MKVAFQGIKGAYGHEALLAFFDKKHDVELIECNFSEQVFDSLENQNAQYAILPIENSIVGNVNVNIDLFIQKNVHVLAELYHPINHCLMANKDTNIKDIREVLSHPVALEQCGHYLKKMKFKAIPEFDTAGSAKMIFESKSKNQGCIASELCSKIYDLEILDKNIQNYQKNYTRFWVFNNVVDKVSGLITSPHQNMKTSICFSTLHQPGSLLSVLEIFAKHRINLSKIESRPVPQDPFSYVFLVDLINEKNHDEYKVCLDVLAKKTKFLKIIGHYPAAEIP